MNRERLIELECDIIILEDQNEDLRQECNRDRRIVAWGWFLFFLSVVGIIIFFNAGPIILFPIASIIIAISMLAGGYASSQKEKYRANKKELVDTKLELIKLKYLLKEENFR